MYNCWCSAQLEARERLLHVGVLGRLLSPPLTLIPEMLASLTSHEVYLLLADARGTVPTPAAFTLDAAGVASRSFSPLETHLTAHLLLVLQNITKLEPGAGSHRRRRLLGGVWWPCGLE